MILRDYFIFDDFLHRAIQNLIIYYITMALFLKTLSPQKPRNRNLFIANCGMMRRRCQPRLAELRNRLRINHIWVKGRDQNHNLGRIEFHIPVSAIPAAVSPRIRFNESSSSSIPVRRWARHDACPGNRRMLTEFQTHIHPPNGTNSTSPQAPSSSPRMMTTPKTPDTAAALPKASSRL